MSKVVDLGNWSVDDLEDTNSFDMPTSLVLEDYVPSCSGNATPERVLTRLGDAGWGERAGTDRAYLSRWGQRADRTWIRESRDLDTKQRPHIQFTDDSAGEFATDTIEDVMQMGHCTNASVGSRLGSPFELELELFSKNAPPTEDRLPSPKPAFIAKQPALEVARPSPKIARKRKKRGPSAKNVKKPDMDVFCEAPPAQPPPHALQSWVPPKVAVKDDQDAAALAPAAGTTPRCAPQSPGNEDAAKPGALSNASGGALGEKTPSSGRESSPDEGTEEPGLSDRGIQFLVEHATRPDTGATPTEKVHETPRGTVACGSKSPLSTRALSPPQLKNDPRTDVSLTDCLRVQGQVCRDAAAYFLIQWPLFVHVFTKNRCILKEFG